MIFAPLDIVLQTVSEFGLVSFVHKAIKREREREGGGERECVLPFWLTALPWSRVSWLGLSGGKNDPKNTHTHQKKKKGKKKFLHICFWKNILIYFPKFSAKVKILVKNGWFCKSLAKLKKKKKKNLPKQKKWISCAHKKGHFLCHLLNGGDLV